MFAQSLKSFFSTVSKKAKMQLTIRTPQGVLYENYEGFSRVLTRTSEAALVIQNRTPPAMYVLPPGLLKIKLSGDEKDKLTDILHLGGWATVHLWRRGSDNTCEINLVGAYSKSEIKADTLDKAPLQKEPETVAGRYMAKIRRNALKQFQKRAAL